MTLPRTSSRQALLAAVVVLALIGTTAGVLARMHQNHRLGKPGLRMIEEPVLAEDGQVVNTNTVALPHRVLDFTSETKPITTVELGWLPADTTYARRVYRAPDGFGIQLNVVLMGQDRSSIHRPQICLTGQGFTIERSDLLEIDVPKPHPYRLPVMRLTASGSSRSADGRDHAYKAVYVYWFVADGQLTARHGQRMWWMARDLLRHGVLQRWAYVSGLAVGPPGSEDALYRRLEEFLAAAVPEFQLAEGSR